MQAQFTYLQGVILDDSPCTYRVWSWLTVYILTGRDPCCQFTFLQGVILIDSSHTYRVWSWSTLHLLTGCDPGWQSTNLQGKILVDSEFTQSDPSWEFTYLQGVILFDSSRSYRVCQGADKSQNQLSADWHTHLVYISSGLWLSCYH